MNTPEQISSETREQFPIGCLVRLSPKGAKFTPKRWHERVGRVEGYAMRDWGSHSKACEPFCRITKPEVLLLVVWEGRTRRRIVRRHRSDFQALKTKRRGSKAPAGGKP